MHACKSLCNFVSIHVMQQHVASARCVDTDVVCMLLFKRDRSSLPVRQDCKLSRVLALLQEPCKPCIELKLIFVSVFVG